MNNDLISRDALKKACAEMVRASNNSDFIPCPSWNNAMELIDNAPTVKFSLMPADETKEDAYKRGYERGKIAGILKANTRPQGETNAEIFKQTFGIYATELWSMKEADFLKWLNAEQD